MIMTWQLYWLIQAALVKYDYISSATLVVTTALLVACDDMQGACTNAH